MNLTITYNRAINILVISLLISKKICNFSTCFFNNYFSSSYITIFMCSSREYCKLKFS